MRIPHGRSLETGDDVMTRDYKNLDVDMRKEVVRKMSEEHRIFLMRCFACDMGGTKAVAELKKQYGISVSYQWADRLRSQPKYYKFFKAFKDEYINKWKDVPKIHLAASINRLKEADGIASGIHRIINKIQEKIDSNGEWGGKDAKGTKKSMKGKSNKIDTYAIQMARQLKSLTESYIEILKYCKSEMKVDKNQATEQPSFLTQININQMPDEEKRVNGIEIPQEENENTATPIEVQEHASDGSISENI